MTASIIDGSAIAKKIQVKLASEIERKQHVNPGYKPSYAIVQVGNRPDSSTYVRMKKKASESLNIQCRVEQYCEDISEKELIQSIHRLNDDQSVHGILIQLPLPPSISESAITSAVSGKKDVDGFGAANIGELSKRHGTPMFVPCTPKGVMVLLQEAGIRVSHTHAVVLGRSDIVGGPLSLLLQKADATVTLCHSKTANVREMVGLADILVVAIGKPQFVKGHWLKPGAVVVDVGTNYVPDQSKKSGQRLVGDVDFDAARHVASYITPVPGGVGPMTVAMLLQNVVDSANYCLSDKDSN